MILQKHYLVEFVLITIPKAISKILYIQPNVFTPGRGFVNAFSYGDMRTTIKFIDYLYPVQIEKKERKIFVSHSSQGESVSKVTDTDFSCQPVLIMHASRSRRFKKMGNRLAVLGPWRNFAL